MGVCLYFLDHSSVLHLFIHLFNIYLAPIMCKPLLMHTGLWYSIVLNASYCIFNEFPSSSCKTVFCVILNKEETEDRLKL
jgi:hypothetical protein